MLAVMHDLPLALSFSDSVAVLQNGKITYFGTPDGLIKSDVIKSVFGVSVSHENNEYYYQISTSNQKGINKNE
jgi:ABC-type cobalamin/Fe3+-siderophores transport system ATPase subunit